MIRATCSVWTCSVPQLPPYVCFLLRVTAKSVHVLQ
jgi:hypothetical protein